MITGRPESLLPVQYAEVGADPAGALHLALPAVEEAEEGAGRAGGRQVEQRQQQQQHDWRKAKWRQEQYSL